MGGQTAEREEGYEYGSLASLHNTTTSVLQVPLYSKRSMYFQHLML